MGLADDIADLLDTGGFSSTIHVGELRARSNKGAVIVHSPGLTSMRSLGGGEVLETLRVQMRCRATSYPVVEDLISSGHAIINGLKDKTINGRLYYFIDALQSPFYIGEDEENRSLFSVNYSVQRSAST